MFGSTVCCLNVAVEILGGSRHLDAQSEQSMVLLLPFYLIMLGCCLQLCSVNTPLQDFRAGDLQM